MKKDLDGTLSRAHALGERRADLARSDIVARLLGQPEPASHGSKRLALPISRPGKVVAKLANDAKGRALINGFTRKQLPELPARKAGQTTLTIGKRQEASVRAQVAGRLVIDVEPGAVPAHRRPDLVKILKAFLAGPEIGAS